MSDRAPVALTVRVLKTGAALAVGILLSALGLHLIGSDVADSAALLGVAALIATPALSLVATVIECWRRERPTAFLALVVLAVLGVAAGVALLLGR